MAYGLRMLVDIAERSLADSPYLDPTTAVQAIDRLHDCLRQLARRPFPDGLHRDDEGVVRLTVPVMSWEAYVHLAFDEIRQAEPARRRSPGDSGASLVDLRGCAPAERIPVLDEQLALLEEEVRRVVPEAELAFCSCRIARESEFAPASRAPRGVSLPLTAGDEANRNVHGGARQV